VQPGRHLCYTNSEALHTVYEMLSVDILVLDQFSLMCVAATVEPLRAANRVAAQALYRWRLLSFDGTAPTSTSGITVAMDAAFAPEEARASTQDPASTPPPFPRSTCGGTVS
jgi:transcriptional regulator GlxA family with amidase domain